MKNEIEAMITDITATTAEAEDYTGEDGLLYCGKCHTPKEAYFPKETAQWLGHDRHPTECDCQRLPVFHGLPAGSRTLSGVGHALTIGRFLLESRLLWAYGTCRSIKARPRLCSPPLRR